MANKKVNLVTDSSMVRAANVLANAVRKYAPYEAIKRSVRLGKREGRGNSRWITVTVGNAKVQYARAFDIGSGIHGKLRRKYTIKPKNARALWFPFPTPRMYPGAFAYENNGVVGITTSSVEHPGVKGTGYTAKAIKEARPKMREILKKDVSNSLRLYLKAEFKDFGK